MANSTYEQLRLDFGLSKTVRCTPKENQEYNEIIQNGQSLPDNLIMEEVNGNKIFYKIIPSSSENNDQYILMRISRDLHFIKTLSQILLAIGIIFVVILLIIFNIH